MRERSAEIGNAILEFLRTVEGCEVNESCLHGDMGSIDGYIDFKWLHHRFQIVFERRGGGILTGDISQHGCHQDLEVDEDLAGIPSLDLVSALEGVGPIGRVPSQLSVDIRYIKEGAGKGSRYKIEQVIKLENPDEVHLLPPKCVQELDKIIIRDAVYFLRWHFRAWKAGGDVNPKCIYDPRACY